MSDLSFGFETLQCRSLNQMAGKQLLFHKRNLSTFCQIWYPRNVHSPCIGALFCLWYLLLYSCNKQRWSHGRHFELLLSTKGHFGRGRVLHTLSDDILDPHIYSSDLLLTNLQWSKKKKKKKSGMYALEWNACERRLEWTLTQSFTWCEIHKPHPISQIILSLLLLNYTPGVRDFECQVSWSFSFTWPRMPAHLQSQSQIAQECKGLELKGIKAVFVFIYFLVTLNKKFCHTFPFCFTR